MAERQNTCTAGRYARATEESRQRIELDARLAIGLPPISPPAFSRPTRTRSSPTLGELQGLLSVTPMHADSVRAEQLVPDRAKPARPLT